MESHENLEPDGSISFPDDRPLRVLVVDDDVDTREMLELLLRSIGWDIVVVGSADEAVEAFHPDRFDILLSDLGMPGADGYELIKRLHELWGRCVPAIAVTGFDSHQALGRAQESGFDGHIVKPFRLAALVEIVERVRRR